MRTQAEKNASDYNRNAIRFLNLHDLKITILRSSPKCPKWGGGGDNRFPPGCCYGTCKSTHGEHYRIWIIRRHEPAKAYRFDFWGSFADFQERIHPSAYDVLACLASESTCPDDPDEVAAEFGPLPPSQAIACAEAGKAIRAFFTASELDDLREIQ